ncbi:unnamed protein product [Malus baccata var. baccata]
MHAQATQKGVIGITLNSGWSVPFSNSTEDKDAALRALDFSYGWFMDPVTRGRYPKSMQRLVGNRLPNFTKEQSKMLKGSYDFVGLNYYSSSYAKDVTANKSVKQPSQSTDSNVESLRVDEANDPKLSLEEALIDKERIKYYDAHLYYVQEAIKNGANVKGFFAWSLLDNFEWVNGYTVRFGIIYVDYKNGLKRHYKLSAHWWKNLLKGNSHSASKHNSSKGSKT